MSRRRRLCRGGGITLLVLGLPLGAAAQPLDLKLQVDLDESGEFRFTTLSSKAIDALPFNDEEEGIQEAATESYKIWADLRKIKRRRYSHALEYQLFVGTSEQGPFTRFRVEGKPVGKFADDLAEVDLFVGLKGTSLERGQISLPIYSLDPPAYVVPQALSNEAGEVRYAEEKILPLPLRNQLPRLPVTLRNLRLQGFEHPSSWLPRTRLLVAGAEGVTQLDLLQGAETTDLLALRLAPATWNALTATLLPVRGAAAKGEDGSRRARHETLVVLAEYATEHGVPRPLRIEVPVHFVPWPPLLLVATILGVLFGSLLPVLARASRRWSAWPRAFLAAVILALMLQGLAMILVTNDSQFRLLGFDLDPFQVLPALLLGALVGVNGFQSLDAFQTLVLDRFWKKGKANDGK